MLTGKTFKALNEKHGFRNGDTVTEHLSTIVAPHTTFCTSERGGIIFGNVLRLPDDFQLITKNDDKS